MPKQSRVSYNLITRSGNPSETGAMVPREPPGCSGAAGVLGTAGSQKMQDFTQEVA